MYRAADAQRIHMTKQFEALATADVLELRIYGPIGAGMFGEGISAESISAAINAAGSVSTITVRMSCPGGSPFDGMAIRSMLAAHPAKKVCEVEGLAASAGSIVAMGCDTIRMHTGSAFMIHEASASGIGRGRVDDLRKVMAALETLNDGMAQLYSERTGMTKVKCRALMAAETWLTPDQAKSQGFCDETVPGKQKIVASFDLNAFGYQHVPAFVAGPVDPPADEQDDDDDDDAGPSTRDTRPDGSPITKEDLRAAMEGLLTRSNSVPQHTAAATTAEASAARKRLQTMSIKLIAQAAGLNADAEDSAVITAVSHLTRFAAELTALTKTSSFDAALGAIRGLQAAAEQVPALSAQIADQAKQLEAQERASLLAADKADPAGRKLTPAMEAFWAERPVSELKAFLAVAPSVLKVEAAKGGPTSQPAPKTEASKEAAAGVLTHNGKAFESMTGTELAALLSSDRELYEQLKANSAERGAKRPPSSAASSSAARA
jgi:ATP-dependent protease ClpP protease subunit